MITGIAVLPRGFRDAFIIGIISVNVRIESEPALATLAGSMVLKLICEEFLGDLRQPSVFRYRRTFRASTCYFSKKSLR